MAIKNDFYIVAREPGAENPEIPTWANGQTDPCSLIKNPIDTAVRTDLQSVPGAFQLGAVLSAEECDRLVALSEDLGFVPDAAVSLPRSIRHNHSLTWVVDADTEVSIWSRCADAINQDLSNHGQRRALGLNRRFRFYRYAEGDFFGPHTDGAWPGSGIENGELKANIFNDRYSELTFLIFLSDGYVGGETEFYIDQMDDTGGRSHRIEKVRTPKGHVLCFPHGSHPLHCVHGSSKIQSGTKYIIRTDVLFEI